MRELVGSALGWAGQCWQSSIHAKLYASGSLMSSSPWERSSFFSSVLAKELRLLWAPMYRVAYTGLVKLVGCRAKENDMVTQRARETQRFFKFESSIYCILCLKKTKTYLS